MSETISMYGRGKIGPNNTATVYFDDTVPFTYIYSIIVGFENHVDMGKPLIVSSFNTNSVTVYNCYKRGVRAFWYLVTGEIKDKVND